MNLASVITLLQLVLSLLTNSATASNPQTQILVSQAMGIASQALSQTSAPVLGSSDPTYTIPTIGSNGGDVAPTSTPDGAPIIYVPAPTSTPGPVMCEYVIPGVKTIESMTCAEIQACTNAHDCPR